SELVKAKEGFQIELSACLAEKDSPESEQTSTTTIAADDDEEEVVFDDLDEEGRKVEGERSSKPNASWVYVKSDSKSEERKSQQSKSDQKSPFQSATTVRNPLYGGAEREHFWELLALGRHFHPT